QTGRKGSALAWKALQRFRGVAQGEADDGVGEARQGPIGRTQGELLLDLLLGALRVRDEHLNALAVELLGRFGEAPIRRLIREATNRKNRPAHRLRVLQAIRRIGRVTDLAAYLDLSVLARDKHPAIRASAAQLLWDLGHPQGDLTEEPGPTMS